MRGVEYARAKEVKQGHSAEIRRRYRKVVGIGIGSVVDQEDLAEAGDEVYGIIVHLEDASGLPTTPQSIEGVPLEFKVTGRYYARPGPSSSC